MISRAYRFIFVHIPKTGGTAVSRALLPYTESRQEEENSPSGMGVGENFATVDPVFGSDKHFTATQYAEFVDLRDYLIFSTVRNPWDRAVSFYFFRKQAHQPDWQSTGPETFDRTEFLHFLRCNEPSQSFLLGKRPVHLLRFETLERDFVALCQRLTIDPPVLPRINASRRMAYRDVLDAELAAEVGRIYAEDVDRFGYSF